MENHLQLAFENMLRNDPDDSMLKHMSESLKEFDSIDSELTDLEIVSSMAEANPNKTSLAGESYNPFDGKLQLSSEDLDEIFSSIGSKIKNVVEAGIKNIGYELTLFDSQVKTLSKNTIKANMLKSNTTISIDVKNSRYMYVGYSKQITNLPDYVRHSSETFEVLDDLLLGMTKLLKDTRFLNLKTLLSTLPVGFDIFGWFRANFEFLLNFSDVMAKTPAMAKVSPPNSRVEYFQSPQMLGGITLSFSRPVLFSKPNNIERSTLKKVISDFEFSVTTDKVNVLRDIVTLDKVTVRGIQDLLKHAEKAASSYESFNTLTNKLFTYLNDVNLLVRFTGAVNTAFIVPAIAYMISARYKALIKMERTLFMMTGMAYYAARNNFKQVNRIASAAINNLDY